MREEYHAGSLGREDLNDDPFVQFRLWFQNARDAGLREVNAMTLSTIGENGAPMARTVLLKDCDDTGFTFFTNYESRKARELAANPSASLLFFWREMERQVQILGKVEKVSREESGAYFCSRPYNSRIGAWASEQSRTIPDREWLNERIRSFSEKFPDTGKPDCVPLPDFWGGYRLLPESFEFWQGQPGRNHDRFVYSKAEALWQIERWSP